MCRDDDDPEDLPPRSTATATPAYSPPEFLGQGGTEKPIEPSFDMWALGMFRRYSLYEHCVCSHSD